MSRVSEPKHVAERMWLLKTNYFKVLLDFILDILYFHILLLKHNWDVSTELPTL